MTSDALIPDTSIVLKPRDNPDRVRPNDGWITPASTKNRIITIDAGDKLQYGGVIQLPDNYNIKHYKVVLSKPDKPKLLKVSSSLSNVLLRLFILLKRWFLFIKA